MPAINITDRCNTRTDLGHAIIMHTYHVLQQMILLYKDPQGKNIFDGTVPTSSKPPGTNDTTDHLKTSESSI